MIRTERTVLRPWLATDRDAFAALHADPEVMADYGGPIDRVASDAKFDRYAESYEAHGFGRWAVEAAADGGFLGYVGIMPIWPTHPVAPGVEVGWRLARAAWGRGYASEAARAALKDGFERCGFGEVLSYTTPANARSQAVMARLGLERDARRDFEAQTDGLEWRGLVWVARPDMDW